MATDGAAPAQETALLAIDDPPARRLRPEEVDLVIYHHNCTDGFASAYCAHRYDCQRRAAGAAREIVFHPGVFDRQPPLDKVRGRNVLLCDFTYKAAAMRALIAVADKVLVLDHHESARAELAGLPPHMREFDMGRSGATMTWEYFNPGVPAPRALAYIEDHDIWAHRLPDTEAFSAYMKCLPFDFEEYGRLMDEDHLDRVAFPQGRGMAKLVRANCSNLARRAVLRFAEVGGRLRFVVYLNSPILQSELGHELMDAHPCADFAATYYVNDRTDATSFSLRSNDAAASVSHIAELFGGGGHRNASGCTIPAVRNTLPGTNLGGYVEYKALERLEFRPFSPDQDRPRPLIVASLETPKLRLEFARYLAGGRYAGVSEATHLRVIAICRARAAHWRFDLTEYWEVLAAVDHVAVVVVWRPYGADPPKTAEFICTWDPAFIAGGALLGGMVRMGASARMKGSVIEGTAGLPIPFAGAGPSG